MYKSTGYDSLLMFLEYAHYVSPWNNCADRRGLIYVRSEAVLPYFYNWSTLLSTFSQLGMHRKKKDSNT